MAEAETQPSEPSSLAEITTEIVAAYVANNTVATTDLPNLISSVGKQLARLERESAEPTKPKPAIAINRSVRKQDIICLICGQSQKLLRRHLMASHELMADDYRSLFGLKSDYPMVAPEYAAQRSALAKQAGLGRKQPAQEGRKKAPGSRR